VDEEAYHTAEQDQRDGAKANLRSRDIVFFPRTTGRLAAAHADLPPSTSIVFIRAAASFWQALVPSASNSEQEIE
jgi:hypothetical protein